jgi:4-alpha-glucanotransferase
MNPLHQRASGVLLHITSLPGPHGMGDFGPGAYHFVDWLHTSQQRIWQFLPTTPIGPANSPYQSVSAFAGSPLMVSLEALQDAGWIEQIAVPAGGFPTDRIDYDHAAPWRMEHLRRAYAGFLARARPEEQDAFAAWTQAQSHWLDDYSLFMTLCQRFAGQPWWQWPSTLRQRDVQALQEAQGTHREDIAFWNFVQWCFDCQCLALKQYAQEKNVSLMGDLPIFVAHHSADCWARPDLYFLDEHQQATVVAGAPPDALAPQGQHWGNPLYRWERMHAEGYGWWIARIQRLMHLHHCFRIDHFRGFAAYWEIPGNSTSAADGKWVRGPGIALFQAIRAALGDLPIVAEDLGVITPDVAKLLSDCQFPGMKVLLFAFAEDGTHEYLPHNYQANCVVYTGTHDTNTVHGWWASASDHERHVAGSYLGQVGEDVHWAMIRAASTSVANTVIFPFQDVLGLGAQERMNVPGTTNGNWSWRFDWSRVGPEPARILGEITSVSGR